AKKGTARKNRRCTTLFPSVFVFMHSDYISPYPDHLETMFLCVQLLPSALISRVFWETLGKVISTEC
ncbi:hypothetical protein Q8G47_28285, partial [Klebsiella pneumoniae]|uniref:hypothetical protein n=1 Tax=Klebsiella pneumoniae TaxID=573 RepID=UPI003013E79C